MILLYLTRYSSCKFFFSTPYIMNPFGIRYYTTLFFGFKIVYCMAYQNLLK